MIDRAGRAAGDARTLGRLLVLVAFALGVLAVSVGTSAAPASAAAVQAVSTYDGAVYTYNAPVLLSSQSAATTDVRGSPAGPGATSRERSVSARGFAVAAKGAPAAVAALKGPIADQVARNLPQQLALAAAREGQGTILMRNLADAPRLVANYGEGNWVKMQYVLRGNDSNVTVHYFRDLATKMDVEFKFK